MSQAKTKVCTKCGKRKRRAQFSKRRARKDGLQGWCKTCHREYGGAWAKSGVGKASLAKTAAKYRTGAKGKAANRRASAKHRANHPERIKARNAANYHAPLAGNCQECGSFTALERHHEDYDNPLDVITVCRQCHEDIHRAEKETA